MRHPGTRTAMLALASTVMAGGCSAGPIEVAAFDKSILQMDLVALWPMDIPLSSPPVAQDESGMRRNGAIIGGTSISGQAGFGSALHFELGNEVEVTPFPDTPPDSGWTLALWVLPEVVLVKPAPGATGLATRFVTLLSTEAVFSGGWEMNIALTSAVADSPHYQFGYWLGPGDSDYLTTAACPTCLVKAEWTHLAVVLEPGKLLTFYVNGAIADTRAMPPPIKPGIGTLFMGRWQTPGNRLFKGALDDVAIYRRALSQREVMALVLAPVPPP
jgi:hypothetical protein